MADKLRVGVIFGGQSSEHDSSIMSAKNVFGMLAREKYRIVPIGITRQGQWLLLEDVTRAIRRMGKDHKLSFQDLIPEENTPPSEKLVSCLKQNVDVLIPVVHGRYGEEGTLQGMLELADVPYVGSGVLACALVMDKAAMKKMLSAHRLPVVDGLVTSRLLWSQVPETVIKQINAEIKYPCVVKPVGAGAGIGVSNVADQQQLREALDKAAELDRRIIIEEAVEGREIAVAVMGNDAPLASVPGEIISSSEKEDAAETGEGGAGMSAPADLPVRTVEKLQKMAVDAFKALDCAGMAQVDFSLSRSGKICIKEIRTIPGFAAGDIFPQLWEHTGISGAMLLDRLIELALERHKEKN